MIRLLNPEQLSKATERAKASNLFVQRTSMYRQYRVTNRETGAEYTVSFFVRNGERYGHCNCKAGVNNQACKHLWSSRRIARDDCRAVRTANDSHTGASSSINEMG